MKKFFLAAVVAVSLVACNSSSDTAEVKKDSVEANKDSMNKAVENTADAMQNANDSAAKKAKDSIDAMHKDSAAKH